MVTPSVSSSSTPNPRSLFTSQPPKRPPLLPSDPPVPRKPKSREVTSRYLSATPSRTAPNTPINPSSKDVNRSKSADRRRPGTPDLTAAAKLLVGNGSKRSLSVSFQGEGFTLGGKGKPGVGDENVRPVEKGGRWPGRVNRSLDCETPRGEKGGHVARVLGMRRSVDDTGLSSVSESSTASDLASSDAESVTSRKPRAIVVPARFLQETNNRLRRLPEQSSTKKSFSDCNPVSSPPRMPGGRGSSPSKFSSALSPSRGKLSPSRVRSVVGTNDYVSNTPSVLKFAADSRRGKVGESKISDMHQLRMLHNRQLQWQFANARANAAMQTQKDTAENTIYYACEKTSRLRHSVESKRVELQHVRQQLKLYYMLKRQMSYLDDWELFDGDYSSSLAGAVESLVASTLRLPLVGGAKANIQEVKDTISSAADVMHGIGSSLCGLLDKVVQTSSLASELANISMDEFSSLDQCRDLLSSQTTMQVEDCCLRTQVLQLTHMQSDRV